MERNRKLTVNIPPHIIEEYGINEDTVFVTYLADIIRNTEFSYRCSMHSNTYINTIQI